MGYTTDFIGRFELSRQLTETEKNYINTFSCTRRMMRNPKKLIEIFKGKYGYPFPDQLEGENPEKIYGKDGEYFAHDDGNFGQGEDSSIIDYNRAPGQNNYDFANFLDGWEENQRLIKEGKCQPGLWCQWVIESEDDKDFLQWNNSEKFYEYVAWLKYLVAHFFERWGVKLNGVVEWTGEDPNDIGRITVKNNVVKTATGTIVYKDEE